MAWHFKREGDTQPPILRYGFWGITHFNMGVDLWWSPDLRRWMSYAEFVDRQLVASNTAPCRSFKAFKRHLRRHPILQQIGFVRLVHKYVGYSIEATWVPESESDLLRQLFKGRDE